MEITELKSRLDIEGVCKHLLPGGKKVGPEFEAGSVGGEAGKSLKVKLTGPKAGVWSDFATGESGDLIDLWRLTRGLSLKDTLGEVKAYLGIKDEHLSRPKKESFKVPERPPVQKVTTDYLYNRELTDDAIKAYKVGQLNNNLIFPFFWNDHIALYKVREIGPEGKPRPTEANCRPVLFGWQAIPEDSRSVTICEGEIDALSLWQYGYPALSVPFGGGSGAKQQWLQHEYHNLDRFEEIYLCLDNDDVGQEAADAIADRLGRHRCKIVTLPRKDANECLQEMVPDEEIEECFRSAKYVEPEELTSAGSFLQDVENIFRPQEGEANGYTVPWGDLNGKLIFRPHELTLWTGGSGAGKSQILSHALVDMIDQGATVCLASLEMVPKQSLKRMVKQLGNVDVPTAEFLKACMDWLDNRLWMYNFVGRADIETLLDGFEYARKRYGVDTFVIDSFMRLGIGVDDYKAQDDAIFRLTDWTVKRSVHMHLVAHARKAGETKEVPETESVKGTSEIGANAFNIVGVFRNRDIEDKLAQAEFEGKQEDIDKYSDLPGVKINVAKQRNGDFEGKRNLYFDQATYRYNSRGDNAKRYVQF